MQVVRVSDIEERERDVRGRGEEPLQHEPTLPVSLGIRVQDSGFSLVLNLLFATITKFNTNLPFQ